MSRPINSVMCGFAVLMISLFCFQISLEAQEIDEKQKAKIERVTNYVDKAGTLYKSKDYKNSAKSIRSARALMTSLAKSGNERVMTKIRGDYDRMKKAIALLEKKGQEFRELPSFEDMAAPANEGSDSKGSSSKEGSAAKSDGELVSFTHDVAPIVVEYCGRCHIEQSRGKYSAATYADLKKGTRKGLAVKPNSIEKSRMVSLIEIGKMPPRNFNKPVPPEKLQVLKDWIEQGAKFDGPRKSQKANLTEFISHGSSSKGSSTKGSASKGSSKR